MRFMAANAAYFALLDVERTDPAFADVFSEGSDVYLDDVRRLVVLGQRDGTITDGDPHLLSIGVLGAVSSFSNSYRSGRLDSTVTVDSLAHFVGQWVAERPHLTIGSASRRAGRADRGRPSGAAASSLDSSAAATGRGGGRSSRATNASTQFGLELRAATGHDEPHRLDDVPLALVHAAVGERVVHVGDRHDPPRQRDRRRRCRQFGYPDPSHHS